MGQLRILTAVTEIHGIGVAASLISLEDRVFPRSSVANGLAVVEDLEHQNVVALLHSLRLLHYWAAISPPIIGRYCSVCGGL